MSSGIVYDTRRYSVQDGPGIRTTVFFKGCHMRCLWCHNPESQAFEPELMPQVKLCINCGKCRNACPYGVANWAPDLWRSPDCRRCGACASACPSEARKLCGERVSADRLVKHLLRDLPFFDRSQGGVTISGGEPLAQPFFLLDVLRRLGKEGIHRCVDTAGLADPDILLETARHCELFLYDLKIIDANKHTDYVGTANEQVLANLRILDDIGAQVIIRIPLIPGYNDSVEDIEAMAIFVRGLVDISSVQFLPYHQLPEAKYNALGREYPLAGLVPPTREEVKVIERLFNSKRREVNVV